MSGFPKADWVRLDHNGGLSCTRCGDAYPMAMPAPLDVIVAAAKAYAHIHKHCREPKSPEGKL